MDDIYDDLENYNEVDVVDELRSENMELKNKLKEYTDAMNQLQTDFDKLNSEYKKLEMNYSSLLKTARSEIERKTQMITTLNKEKDMLVISSMQKGRRNILNNFNREVYNKRETEKKDGDKDQAYENQNKSGPKTLNVSEDVRSEVALASPKNNFSCMGTANSEITVLHNNSSSSSENKNRNTSDKQCSDSKENISKSVSDQSQKDNKSKSMKLKNRRQSMPVRSNWDGLSSEEEVNNHIANKHSSNRHQLHENKNYNNQYERKSYKTSEYSSYESRNNYSNERYMDNYKSYQRDSYPLELQRNAHVYQTRSHTQLYPRHSPERDRYKPYRMYNHSQRLDYIQRVSESPPSDKYKRSKSRERRYQERDYNDYSNKYKQNDYNCDERDYTKEPDYKRRKVESAVLDAERIDRCMDRKSYKHSDYSSSLKHENYTSCQSPDYDQFELAPTTQHFVKEIKNTATVQLEDPRITSKKYLLKETDEGNFITRACKNVSMTPIDKIKWGIEKVAVPEALKEHPSTSICNDDLIKNIYMDIDIPPVNIEEWNKNQITEDKSHMPVPSSDTFEVTGHKEDTSNLKNHEDLITRTMKANDQTPKTLSIHYKIPKKSSSDSKGIIQSKKIVDEDSKKDEKTVDEDSKKGEKRLEKGYKAQSKDMDGVNNCSTKLKNQVQRLAPIKDNVEGDLELSDEASDITEDIHVDDDKVKVNISVHDKIHDIKCKEIDNPKYKTANENIVDESINKIYDRASEKDATKKIDKFENKIFEDICEEKITKKGEVKNTVSKIDTIEKNTEDSKSCYSRKHKEERKVIVPIKIEECKNTKKEFPEEAVELNECKTSKSQTKDASKREKRKRSSKSDTDKSLQESQVHSENFDSYTKIQPKDSQTKNKFTELFGENSSLITPHDLGIMTKFEINEVGNDKYGSLFENTQDAIDFNVREIQEKLNTEKNTNYASCIESVPGEDEAQKTSSYNNKKPIFQIDDKRSSDSVFKNLKPADSENEPNIVKTIVISSGKQPHIEVNEMHEKDLPKVECNDEKVADKQLSLELLKAVATSTPHKIHLEVPSRLSEVIRVPSNESLNNNDDISVSNTSPTSKITAPETNAPDVRIFLKRRRKIKKT